LLTKLRAAMKAQDPQAIVLGPAVAAGATQPTDAGMPAIMMLLDKRVERASLEYSRNGKPYAVGPQVDAVSFHNYEDLDGSTAEQTYANERPWWDLYSTQAGFAFDPDLEFWLTEGGRWTLDDDWAPRWFPQYFARGFAGGITRMIVQGVAENGLTKSEASVATFVRLFPDPAGMTKRSAPADPAQIYRDGDATWTYVAWATGGTATVSIPVRTATATVIDVAGNETTLAAVDGAVTVTLPHASMFNEPLYVQEQPPA
ncbi:MAG TPA: hypothetical protein VKA30_12415, partial [Actinomycetota bacterium]|nr:hypothetical protein [Actinomycetota bacterium]